MPANAFVRARIDPAIKSEAAKVLPAMGLTVSDVCRMALTRVAYERRLPFNDPEPNELTRITMEKTDRGEDVFYAKDFADLMRQLRS
jgi:DNA-damage-inducible protein J